MGIKIDVVTAHRWQGIYFNDKLVDQGWPISIASVLEKLENEIVDFSEELSVDLDWFANERYILPENLEDVAVIL